MRGRLTVHNNGVKGHKLPGDGAGAGARVINQGVK